MCSARLSRSRPSNQLHMDHVRISLTDFLLTEVIVGIPTLLLGVWGGIKLLIAKTAKCAHIIQEPSQDALSRLAADILLETSLVIGLQDVVTVDGGERAIFSWSPFPHFIDTETGVTAKRTSVLTVIISLDDRNVTQAHLDSTNLTMTDLIVLLCNYLTLVQHPKIHAFGNWATDVEDQTHPFLRMTSIVTAYYNFLGYSRFPAQFEGGALMFRTGLHSLDLMHAVSATIDEALKVTVPPHGNVQILAKHSRFTNFLTKVRGKFMSAFGRLRQDIPALYSAEAYFLGTVVHSLDHFMYGRTMIPFVLASLNPSKHFRSMKHVQDIVRFMFIDDLPGILFPRTFKGSPVRFHQEVFQEAFKIDPLLADQMQTCIVK